MPALADPLVRSLADVQELESVSLEDRDLPGSTYELLARTADRCPDVVAWRFLPDPSDVTRSVDVTYAQLLRRTRQVAHVLEGLHGGRGVTALLAPSHLETPALVLGAQTAGIFCAVNHMLDVEHIAAILRAAQAEVLVALGPSLGRDTWDKAKAVTHLVPGLKALLQVRADLPVDETAAVLEELLVDAPAPVPATLPKQHEIAAYFHTGGTTGDPKLAAHSHRNQVANAWMMNSFADGKPTEGLAILAGLPYFHVNAWMVTGLATFEAGATAIVPGPDGYRDPRFYPAAWRLISAFSVSAMSAVPTVYSALTQVPLDADISCLQHPFVGAAPLTDALADAWLAHTGVELLEGYGCTETTCTVTTTPRLATPRRGSQGVRMPYTELRIVGMDEEQVLPSGAAGRVLISGPQVFAGYVQADGSVRPPRADGWYDTGDLGRLDADGWLRLTGRAKDLIIRGGHNIDPALVVEAMERHPAVVAAAAVGRPDAHAGEVPVVYVQLAAGADASERELLEHAQRTVPERAAVPKAVHILANLPVSVVGKVSQLALREDACERAVREHLLGRGIRVTRAKAATDPEGLITVRVALDAGDMGSARALVRVLPVAVDITAG